MSEKRKYILEAIRLKTDPPASHKKLKRILTKQDKRWKDCSEYQVIHTSAGYKVINFLDEKRKKALYVGNYDIESAEYDLVRVTETEVLSGGKKIGERLNGNNGLVGPELLLKKVTTTLQNDEANSIAINDELLDQRKIIIKHSDDVTTETIKPSQPSVDTAYSSGQSREEINDLIGNAPGWLLRSGILMIALVTTLVLGMSAIIKYPDKIIAQGEITTERPPIPIVAQRNNRISRLYVEDKQEVKKGDEILYLHNSAVQEDVIALKEWLAGYSNGTIINSPPQDLQVGELQTLYAQLILSHKQYLLEKGTKSSENQIVNINSELQNLSALQSSIDNEKVQFQREQTLSQKELARSKDLFEIGAISKQELENAERQYAQVQRNIESIEKAKIQSLINQDQLRLEREKIRESRQVALREGNYRLQDVVVKLLSEYNRWFEDYYVISESDGVVDMKLDIVEESTLQAGQTLGYVIPSTERNKKYIQAKVPSVGIAKLDSNSTIITKIDAYPYKEYGTLSSSRHVLSILPYVNDANGEIFYQIRIPLEDSLKTHYGKILNFRPKMTVTLEMITEDKSILTRIFEQIIDVIYKS